ncbi:MAG TPA: 30S ribosomal protein THX [Burkholderiales bacterium]|nr:30S ribosomal protein THX [Burkholderiales bacterium]
MGKSDTRTLRGKICNGSYGTQRPVRAGKKSG